MKVMTIAGARKRQEEEVQTRETSMIEEKTDKIEATRARREVVMMIKMIEIMKSLIIIYI